MISDCQQSLGFSLLSAMGVAFPKPQYIIISIRWYSGFLMVSLGFTTAVICHLNVISFLFGTMLLRIWPMRCSNFNLITHCMAHLINIDYAIYAHIFIFGGLFERCWSVLLCECNNLLLARAPFWLMLPWVAMIMILFTITIMDIDLLVQNEWWVFFQFGQLHFKRTGVIVSVTLAQFTYPRCVFLIIHFD